MFESLDNMFDFDNSGDLDTLEESAKFSFIMGLMEEEKNKDDEDDF